MNAGILIVDDDPNLRRLLSLQLKLEGYEVSEAESGEKALALFPAALPQLVITDMRMGGMDGLALFDSLHKSHPGLPVIILTAHGTIRLAVEAMKDGAVDFLTKPFEPGQLDSVVAKALERNELKGEITRLLGEISHDVKNLLMPLVTGTDLLADEIDDLFKKLPEMEAVRAQKSHNVCDEVIEMLRSASNRIQDRMKGIADYVAVTRAPQKFESCQIAKVAQSVAKSLRVLVEQKQIVLRIEGLDTLPPIMADENRLYSALYNLIHNAIPEVPARGSITIRGCLDATNKFIVLTIQDTGKGMSPQVLGSLFTARVISRKAGGTGLGTKIVKDVVDAHGGQIAVESQEGKGTTFVIRLPFHPPAFPGKPVGSA